MKHNKLLQFCLILLILLPYSLYASSDSNTNKTYDDKKGYSSLALVKGNKVRLYSKLKVGNQSPEVLVIVDTGSSWLLLEERFVSDYQETGRTIKTGYGYNKGTKHVVGKLVYADVTLNSIPKLIAKKVPIIMVPNGSIKGISGILGLKINTQNSLLNYLPKPYNEVVIIDAPNKKLTFTKSSKSLLKNYQTFKLRKGGCSNLAAPIIPINQVKCWQPGKIPITYTFVDDKGNVILKNTFGTLFDSGGVNTQFALAKLPNVLEKNSKDGYLKGKIKSAVFVGTNYQIPTTEHIKITKSMSNHINSGYLLFYDRTVLFDTVLGVVGIK
ncbi:hypothetical protein L3V82_07335 [Thiotrichales bacterium 19S3-7]|nr:hypothetical protein [Thiotrichales bacterium 19S3-7]MCF6801970.1 hypothetical protein [Thiotrichales bacterium 19S3-11]